MASAPSISPFWAGPLLRDLSRRAGTAPSTGLWTENGEGNTVQFARRHVKRPIPEWQWVLLPKLAQTSCAVSLRMTSLDGLPRFGGPKMAALFMFWLKAPARKLRARRCSRFGLPDRGIAFDFATWGSAARQPSLPASSRCIARLSRVGRESEDYVGVACAWAVKGYRRGGLPPPGLAARGRICRLWAPTSRPV
jgi:hypothetical protein